MIDLRTDFISRPTAAMIDAMVEAARAYPDFSMRGDPTVARLERLAAERLGKEDALFCPTCTMANQIAILLACGPGDAFVAEASSHVMTAELASAGALGRAVPAPVPGRNGVPDMTLLEEALAGTHTMRARTGIVVVENTHVMSGGRAVPVEAMKSIRTIAAAHRVPLHLDGARLFNAAVRLGVDARLMTATADTVSLSLNKGLCAPMGAVLAGPQSVIAEAARVRAILGGAWRPANIPAAAAIVALDTMVDRLAEDHQRTAELAKALARLSVVDIDPASVETNIILGRVDSRYASVKRIVGELAALKVLVLPFGKDTIRLCLHREIGRPEVEATIAAFQTVESALLPKDPFGPVDSRLTPPADDNL